jgi:hypothetical protein
VSGQCRQEVLTVAMVELHKVVFVIELHRPLLPQCWRPVGGYSDTRANVRTILASSSSSSVEAR